MLLEPTQDALGQNCNIHQVMQQCLEKCCLLFVAVVCLCNDCYKNNRSVLGKRLTTTVSCVYIRQHYDTTGSEKELIYYLYANKMLNPTDFKMYMNMNLIEWISFPDRF